MWKDGHYYTLYRQTWIDRHEAAIRAKQREIGEFRIENPSQVRPCGLPLHPVNPNPPSAPPPPPRDPLKLRVIHQ